MAGGGPSHTADAPVERRRRQRSATLARCVRKLGRRCCTVCGLGQTKNEAACCSSQTAARERRPSPFVLHAPLALPACPAKPNTDLLSFWARAMVF